jgi:serine/threonine-protein kinase
MCAALHVAHAAGIIHRDLKPANVMLIERAGQGDYVKVLDFGVAKSYTPDQQTQLTHTGMLVGTVEYMAPEQIMGRTVDGRTDIYSLGVVMYRMFTGKAPFRDGGVPALIHAHLNVFAKPMTDTAPELPGALDRVVLRCLAKQPEQRYESMEEVSRALVAALEPAELGLLDLEYQGDDPYDANDKTEIGKTARESRPEKESSIDESFDDATVKMDRPDKAALGSPRAAPAAHPADDPFDRTAIMSREESTAKRAVPEAVARFESSGPRECAMCRTMNAPHARACTACGVSLAREDQEAVRARVTAPRTAHLSAPQIPPPTSGAYPAPPPPFGHSPAQGIHGIQAGQGMQGAQGMQGSMQGSMQGMAQPGPQHGAHTHGSNSAQGMAWGSLPPSTHAPSPPPSAWQRFLTWTGLKTR